MKRVMCYEFEGVVIFKHVKYVGGGSSETYHSIVVQIKKGSSETYHSS